MRAIVCGGRAYANKDLVFQTLDDAVGMLGLSFVIQGGAGGADGLARQWCRERGVEFVSYPAAWRRLGNRAGPIRNKEMLDECHPDMVIAFPGGRGTANMIMQAEKVGVRVERMSDEA